MKKVYFTDRDIDGFVLEIVRQVINSAWKPDYIVGLTRGGLIPAVKISHYLGVPLETLKVSFRDNGTCESNTWMAEEAFNGKKMLFIDDINDSGATLNWIKNDWQSSCPNTEDTNWETIWHDRVRFATLVHNENSEFDVDYHSHSINKLDENVWIVFPWENWWRNA